MFSTVNVPVTVSSGVTSVQLNDPSQSRSGIAGGAVLPVNSTSSNNHTPAGGVPSYT